MSPDLEGRVALVVGAGASGPGGSIGEASAVAYARAGAAVAAIDISEAAADRTAALVEAAGGTCLALRADATEPDQIGDAIARAVARFGRLDILHNNVGIQAFGGPEELPVEDWDRVVHTNGRSHFLACKYALPHLVASGNGAVTNVSSIAGIRWIGVPYPAYAASKAATIGFTRALALQYADRRVRVNCVVPGIVESAMMRGGLAQRFGPDQVDRVVAERAARLPMKRLARPEDIANACVFLAGDGAAYITAAVLTVDGGLSASSVV